MDYDSGEAASGPLRDPAAEAEFSADPKDAATSRHLSAPQSRRPNAMVCGSEKMGQDGLEPSTLRLSGVRSNHLSYWPKLEGIILSNA